MSGVEVGGGGWERVITRPSAEKKETLEIPEVSPEGLERVLGMATLNLTNVRECQEQLENAPEDRRFLLGQRITFSNYYVNSAVEFLNLVVPHTDGSSWRNVVEARIAEQDQA